jgi:hypothetical protein
VYTSSLDQCTYKKQKQRGEDNFQFHFEIEKNKVFVLLTISKKKLFLNLFQFFTLVTIFTVDATDNVFLHAKLQICLFPFVLQWKKPLNVITLPQLITIAN